MMETDAPNERRIIPHQGEALRHHTTPLNGRSQMKTRIMAALAATTLALSMGVATAGEISGPSIRDGSSPGYLQQQQQLLTEPGYSVGSGAAYVGDGSDSNYEATQRALRNMPGFKFGEASAQIAH
jgi:hypothetical protein